MTVLNDLIRAELDAAGNEVDYDAVTAKVVASISNDEIDEILRYLVRRHVQHLAALYRQRAEGEVALAEIGASTPGTPGPSRRSQCVPAYKRWLGELIIVHSDGQPKRIGMCTADDFRYVAAQRLNKAKELAAVARWYESIAQAMDAAKATTLAKLPPATLDAIFRNRKDGT